MQIPLGVVAGAVVAAVVGALPFFLRRKDPKEKERRRRELVATRGRAIEGCANDFADGCIVYTYEWRGVRYEASQDIAEIVSPEAAMHPITGAVTVKFLPNAPANSIVMAEKWSGIPALEPVRTTGRP